jgi:hypothetical protein
MSLTEVITALAAGAKRHPDAFAAFIGSSILLLVVASRWWTKRLWIRTTGTVVGYRTTWDETYRAVDYWAVASLLVGGRKYEIVDRLSSNPPPEVNKMVAIHYPAGDPAKGRIRHPGLVLLFCGFIAVVFWFGGLYGMLQRH